MGVKIKNSKKDKAAPEKKASKVSAAQPGNPLATLHPSVAEWNEDADAKTFKVELGNASQGAIIKADTKGEAKERFLELFGIQSTDQPLIVKEVDEDHGLPVDCNGVIDYHYGKRGTPSGRPRQDEDND